MLSETTLKGTFHGQIALFLSHEGDQTKIDIGRWDNVAKSWNGSQDSIKGVFFDVSGLPTKDGDTDIEDGHNAIVPRINAEDTNPNEPYFGFVWNGKENCWLQDRVALIIYSPDEGRPDGVSEADWTFPATFTAISRSSNLVAWAQPFVDMGMDIEEEEGVFTDTWTCPRLEPTIFIGDLEEVNEETGEEITPKKIDVTALRLWVECAHECAKRGVYIDAEKTAEDVEKKRAEIEKHKFSTRVIRPTVWIENREGEKKKNDGDNDGDVKMEEEYIGAAEPFEIVVDLDPVENVRSAIQTIVDQLKTDERFRGSDASRKYVLTTNYTFKKEKPTSVEGALELTTDEFILGDTDPLWHYQFGGALRLISREGRDVTSMNAASKRSGELKDAPEEYTRTDDVAEKLEQELAALEERLRLANDTQDKNREWIWSERTADDRGSFVEKKVLDYDCDNKDGAKYSIIFDMLNLSDYLDDKDMYDCCKRAVAFNIKNKSAEEIMKEFGVPTDLSQEDIDKIIEENEWLKDEALEIA